MVQLRYADLAHTDGHNLHPHHVYTSSFFAAAAGQQLTAAALAGSYMDMANYAGYMHPSALPLANAANYYGMPQHLGLAATATPPSHIQERLQ